MIGIVGDGRDVARNHDEALVGERFHRESRRAGQRAGGRKRDKQGFIEKLVECDALVLRRRPREGDIDLSFDQRVE
jgi:hypothetical protein